jgi:hypothetical protein
LSLRKARSVNSPGRARRRRGSRGRPFAVAFGGGFEAAREQQLHDDRPAVRLQLEHVFAGVGMRRRKVDRQAAVDRRALPVEKGHEGRVPRLEDAAAERGREPGEARARKCGRCRSRRDRWRWRWRRSGRGTGARSSGSSSSQRRPGAAFARR